MQLLKFKVLIFMVIHRLVYVANIYSCLWIGTFMDGVPSIKWSKYFMEDLQWILIEAKMCWLDITR